MSGGSIKKNQWCVFLCVINGHSLARLHATTKRLQRDMYNIKFTFCSHNSSKR